MSTQVPVLKCSKCDKEYKLTTAFQKHLDKCSVVKKDSHQDALRKMYMEAARVQDKMYPGPATKVTFRGSDV